MFPCSPTLPEACAYADRLRQVLQEMHIVSCHLYAGIFHAWELDHVRAWPRALSTLPSAAARIACLPAHQVVLPAHRHLPPLRA